MIYRNPLPCLRSKWDAFQVKPVASVHCSKTGDNFVEGAGYNASSVVLPSVRKGYVVLCQIVRETPLGWQTVVLARKQDHTVCPLFFFPQGKQQYLDLSIFVL